jgi:hypothetical protein
MFMSMITNTTIYFILSPLYVSIFRQIPQSYYLLKSYYKIFTYIFTFTVTHHLHQDSELYVCMLFYYFQLSLNVINDTIFLLLAYCVFFYKTLVFWFISRFSQYTDYTCTAWNNSISNELERIWKETVMVHSRYCPEIFLENLIKTRKPLDRISAGSIEAKSHCD